MRPSCAFLNLAWIPVLAFSGMGNLRGAEEPPTGGVTQGALRVVQKDGSVVECPLRHTDVRPRSRASSPG